MRNGVSEVSAVAELGDGALVGAEPDGLTVMTEVDLLPQWYPVAVRRRRRLLLQAWLTGVVMLLMGGVLVWRQANVEATHVELVSLAAQRRAADRTLADVAAAHARLTELSRRAELVSRMGLPLETTRIVSEICGNLPADVALTSLDLRTEERAAAPDSAANAGRTGSRGSRGAPMRQMHFGIAGLAASSDSVFALGEHLKSLPLLHAVRIAGTQATQVYGRPAVAFEISFRIDLRTAGAIAAPRNGGL